MFDSFPFERVTGARTSPELKLFRLSGCAFCEQAEGFLEQQGFSYDRLVVDRLPLGERQALRNSFHKELGLSLSFPALVVDGRSALVGFNRWDWEREILKGNDR